MPKQMSTVMFAEPEYAPGRLIMLRTEFPEPDQYVWCGKLLGWRPFKTTNNALFCFFSSDDEAQKAADKYINLPLQE